MSKTARVIVNQENYFDSDSNEDSLQSSPEDENDEELASEPDDDNEERLTLEPDDENEELASEPDDENEELASELDDEERLTSEPDDENEDRLSSESADETEGKLPLPQDDEKSGMASVIARILSKDTSKSNRVLLAKGKTSKEILRDISERKRQREESENVNVETTKQRKVSKDKSQDFTHEEKKKIWESMGRKIPSIFDNPKEVKLRKIATQGMVQLFRLVSSRQTQG